MEVILLEKVDNLGGLGDKVKVKGGYGRNYLIPSGKATLATPANVARFEERRAELERSSSDALTAAKARRDALEGLEVTIAAKAGDEGKLFGSVGTSDIVHTLGEAGYVIERHEVRLPEGAFRVIGEYEVSLHLHADVDATIRVIVVPE
jgi:large subunit ribosomal protein L9